MKTLPNFFCVTVRDHSGVLFVTLNQPQNRNALALAMVAELERILEIARSEPDVRGIALRGTGGLFCAGGDLSAFRASLSAPHERVAYLNRNLGRFFERVASCPVPVLGVVEGVALGGGFGLACACDVVVASDTAVFALSETGLGLVPAQIAPFVVARVGLGLARRLALFGERVSGEMATRLGLADEVVPASEIDETEARWLTRLARGAPHANRATKKVLLASQTEPLAAVLDDGALAFATSLQREGKFGIESFFSKTEPPWRAQFDAASVRAAHAIP